MNLKEVALQYIEAGLCALPAIKTEKRPAIGKRWKEYQYRLPTDEEWKCWFADALCIVCGKISGHLRVIDFDQKGKAFEAFKTKCPKELFDGIVIETSQSGGYHAIFRTDTPVNTDQKLAKDADGKTLIETLGEGKLFLCAPTPGYALIQGNFQNIPTLQEHEAKALLELARALNEYQESPPLPPPSPKRSAPIQMDGKRPGDVLNEDGIGFIKDILQKHGWTYVGQKGEHDELWRRPGKKAGHSAILHTDTPTFYVFSSDAAPLDVKTYTYFTAYATLEHGGDFSTAAKELVKLGYGDALTATPVDLCGFLVTPPSPPEQANDSPDDDDDCPGQFPEHLLNVPGFVGELSQFINETSTARQPVFALAASIALQSLLCAHNIKDPTDIRTNPYILSVGRTACGKNRGRVVIREIMKRLKDMPAIKDWYDPTHYVANRIASAEAIGTYLGVNNGILMWLWDEVGRALDTPEHKRPTNINALITAMMILYTSANDEYDPNLRADPKNTKPAIEQPNFILYGTSTKEKMFEGFSAGNLEDGLLGRLLIFEGNDDWEDIEQEDVQPVTQSIVDQAHWWFCQRANRINSTTPAPKTVEVTNEAKALLRQLAETKKRIRKEKNTIKDALWGRVVEQARQLALVYAASANHENPIIDESAAQWACDLIIFLTKRKYHLAKRHIAGSEFDKNQKEVFRFIEEQNGKCTKNMICRHFRKFKQWERHEILDNLLETEAIYIIDEKPDGMRQKTALYVVNKKTNQRKKGNEK